MSYFESDFKSSHESRYTREYVGETFEQHWRADLRKQSKMKFYNDVKAEFREEPYLELKSRPKRVCIAKLRSSSHDLRVELGRYTSNRYNESMKTCRFCCSEDPDVIANLEELPFFETPIIENEDHVLTTCPEYHFLRINLSDNLKSLIMLKEYGAIMTSHHIEEFGKYLVDSWGHRNPHKKMR